MKNDFDKAIRDATQAIQLDTKSYDAYDTRAWARYGKGDVAKALEDCQQAVKLIGTNSDEAAWDQGLMNFINSSYAQAVDSWQKAIQYDPSAQRVLQPWINKARAKLETAK
jgi:tetratricopeptide (TPR) repeat protein